MPNESTQVILSNLQGSVALSPTAAQYQLQVLTALSGITAVNTPEQQLAAVNACRSAKNLIAGVESLRQQLKKPALDFSTKLDQTAKNFSKPVADAVDAVMAMVNAFQKREADRVAAAAAAQRLELERLAREQAEIERSVAAMSAQATTDDEREIAANLAAAAKDEAATQMMAVVSAPDIAPARVAGMSVREQWNYEVTNPALAYAAHPEFFKLVENKTIINRVISDGGGSFSCPGVRVWQETKTSVRR